MYPCSRFEVIPGEHYRKHDLFRNLNIFIGNIFLSKNTKRTPQNAENDKIYQL